MAGTPAVPDMRLELVPLPVSDVDRARAFYEQAGFAQRWSPTPAPSPATRRRRWCHGHPEYVTNL